MKNKKSKLASVLRLMWRHKFYSICGIFFLYMCFISEHSLYNIMGLTRQEDELKREIAVYKDSIQQYEMRINEVSVDEEQLERHARERMRMHRENEDLYLVK